MSRSGGIGFLFLCLLTSGCGGTTVSQIAGPEPVRCQIGLSSSTIDVGSTATQVSVGVSADRECAWTSRADATWLQPSPSAGQGDGTVTIAVAGNFVSSPRSGHVAVNDTVVRVNQAAAPGPPPPPPAGPCTYRLDPASRAINENGGSRTVRVITGANCPWVAATTVSWITIAAPTNGIGTATISYTVARNTSDDDRIGVITVTGQTHLIRQDGDD